MVKDSFREALEKAKKGCPMWQPQENDSITGEYLALRTVETKRGKRCILDLRDDETLEEVGIWAGTVIQKELERQNIQPGERIGLKYCGRRENYHDWIIMVDRSGVKDGS